jgi:hypothetical protein
MPPVKMVYSRIYANKGIKSKEKNQGRKRKEERKRQLRVSISA